MYYIYITADIISSVSPLPEDCFEENTILSSNYFILKDFSVPKREKMMTPLSYKKMIRQMPIFKFP